MTIELDDWEEDDRDVPAPAQPVHPTKPRQNLADFLLESPLHGSGITLERIKDYPEPIEL
jgi:hypothetical protein